MDYATRHLYFPSYEPLGECVCEENTSDIVSCSMVSHEKALHNYFISCLYLWKIHGNFRKVRKSPAFPKTSEALQNCFQEFLIFKIFGKSSEIFGNDLKLFFRSFMTF